MEEVIDEGSPTQAVDTTKQVTGTTTFGVQGLSNPAPAWVRIVVRSATWATGFWALVIQCFDMKDFGVTLATENKILKIAASATLFISIIARFIGVKPISFKDDA